MLDQTRRTLFAVVASTCMLGFAACTQKDTPQSASGMMDSTAMAGGATSMVGMPGMSGMADSSGMTADMHTHLAAMMGADGAGMQSMMADHRQKVANMLAKMNGEMTSMNMTATAEWAATVDSIRQDLVRMPTMDTSTLKAAMPGHDMRVRRLAAMHAMMMKPSH